MDMQFHSQALKGQKSIQKQLCTYNTNHIVIINNNKILVIIIIIAFVTFHFLLCVI